jgi:hypothetical protein
MMLILWSFHVKILLNKQFTNFIKLHLRGYGKIRNLNIKTCIYKFINLKILKYAKLKNYLPKSMSKQNHRFRYFEIKIKS